MNNKGFILIDSLVSIVIVSTLAILSMYTYNNYVNYYKSYYKYQEEISDMYLDVLANLGECEKCQIIEASS